MTRFGVMIRNKEPAVKQMIDEFRDFINKGDVVTIAVGLIMALYFQQIVQALLDGVILPIVAAIFGEANYTNIGFDIGDARISIGLVLDAIITFLAVAFILFVLIKAYNAWKDEEESDAGPTEVELLTEIRDSLRNR